MTVRPDLSIVSPVYACEGCLEDLCERLRSTLDGMRVSHEIILVCDASPDNSWQRIREIASRDAHVVGLRLARNVGQHCAISAGLEHARGAWIVVMDCDLQDVPEEIPALYAKATEGHDIVFAQRIERQDTWFKRFASRSFYRLLGYLTGTRYDASTANFGIFSARAIHAVNALPERGRFFPLMVRWAGYPAAVLPVAHARRASGKTTYSFGKLLRLAIEIVLSYSDKPLRLVAKLGVTFSLLAVALAAWSIYRFLHGEVAVAGYTSIIASVWLLGGIIVFCTGVVGLYIGRMFNEIKQRPYYTIREAVNLADAPARTMETDQC
jgi:dolichol-phosphate mannosyltransferase